MLPPAFNHNMLPPNIKHHALLGLCITFLTLITFLTIFPGNDPYRCRSLIQTGRWIDPALANGSRLPFAHWQPDGCIMKKFESEDIQRCVQGRKMVYGGDSTSRRPMRQTTVLLAGKEQIDRVSPTWGMKKDINATVKGIDFFRDANMYLHTDFDVNQTRFMAHLREYKSEKILPSRIPVEEQTGPAIFYFSAGVWITNPTYLRGVGAKGRVKLYTDGLTNVSTALGPNPGSDFWRQPLDPVEGTGNLMFYAPPHGPSPVIHKRRRRIPLTEAMRAWVAEHEDELNFPILWANMRMVVGQNDTWNGDRTGFHVSWEVNTARVNIVLNARCNARLDRMRPHDEGTCCTDYGPKPIIQLLTVSGAIVWLVLCIGFSMFNLLTSSRDEQQQQQQQQQPRFLIFSTQTAAFPLVLLMSYFADRTQMMPKGERIFYQSTYAIFIAIIMVIALATIRKSPKEEGEYQPIGSQFELEIETETEAEPHDLLPKPVTEEWKGWMMLVLLSYHWSNASTSEPLFITSRILIAAYLLLLCYTHTSSYLSPTPNFSFHHLSSKLLRLNLLASTLTYIMNTNSSTYYIAPLLTFWTLITYATLSILPRLNDDPSTLLPKVAISGILVTFLLNFTPLISWTHWILELIFNIQSSPETWSSHLTFNTLPPYIGITLAILSKHHPPPTILCSTSIFLTTTFVVGTFFYLLTPLSFNTDTGYYPTLHNLTSFLPILAYITLRTHAKPLRDYHSFAMAWVGRSSLETYILQLHLLTASTSQGVLLIDGLSGGDATLMGRLASLLIIVPIFLWVSSEASKATTVLVKILIGEGGKLDDEGYEGGSSVALQVAKMPAVKIGALLTVMWTANLLSPEGMKAPVY